MSTTGVNIFKGAVGANVSGKPFQIMALLTTGVGLPAAGMVTLNTLYKLYSIEDAEAIGITKAYDLNNRITVWEHINEFFRMAGAGKKLYLMVVAQGTLVADMIDDTGNIYARAMIAQAQGEINTIGIGFNPMSTYVPTYVDGLDSQIRGAIVKAQALHQWSYDTFRPVNVVLENRDYNAVTATAAIDLRAIPDGAGGLVNADRVTLVTGQDYARAAAVNGPALKYAAIGNFLGVLAGRDVNVNPGEVEGNNITDVVKGKMVSAGLSNHTLVANQEAAINTLDAKGYVVPVLYTGISGYRWNDGHVCTPIVLDSAGNLNAHTIELGRAHDYTVRRLRAALLPQVKKVKPVNTKNGLMPIGIIKELEGYGDQVFADLAALGYISGGKTWIDPASDILIAKTVRVKFTLVPTGNIGEITGTINLKSKL